MSFQENSKGKPLSDINWLLAHHQAKLPERTEFTKRLTTFNPKSIVDLGCASGLWFELLNDFLPNECEFVGFDCDEELLSVASKRSASWTRKVSFHQLDIENDVHQIPPSDLTLAFNVFPYIHNLEKFINTLSNRLPRGILAIRQYDGASIRFGSMPTNKRQEMEIELRLATESSQRFKHYDMDRAFSILKASNYQNQIYDFELFKRFSPFPKDFIRYFKNTMEWTCQFVSDKSADYIRNWMKIDSSIHNQYFYEVDLIALLS